MRVWYLVSSDVRLAEWTAVLVSHFLLIQNLAAVLESCMDHLLDHSQLAGVIDRIFYQRSIIVIKIILEYFAIGVLPKTVLLMGNGGMKVQAVLLLTNGSQGRAVLNFSRLVP